MTSDTRVLVVVLAALLCGSALAGCSLLLDPSALTRDADADGGHDSSVDGGDSGGDAPAGTTRYRDAVLADAPSAYFRFDETSGPARSEVGGFTGAPVGAPAFAVPGALVGDPSRAFGPSGRGGLDLGPVFDFVGTAPFSIEQWVSVSLVDNAFRLLVMKSAGSGATREAFGAYLLTDAAEGPRLVFERFVGGQSRLAVVPAPSVGAYHHVVLTYDGSALAVWVDGIKGGGVLDGRPAGPKQTSLFIGTPDLVEPGFQPTAGSIDELAIYTRALPDDRVIAHFRAGRGLP
jgi:hypothetical protein